MNLLDKAGILAGFPWTPPGRLQESAEMGLIAGTGLLQKYNLTEYLFLDFIIAGFLTPYHPILGPPKIADCLWRCGEYQRLRDLLKQYPTITNTATSDWKGPWEAWEEKNELTWKLEELLPNHLEELLSSLYDLSEVAKLFENAESAKEPPGFKTKPLADDAIKRAVELKPITDRLYDLTMQKHKPLMNHKPEACLKTALDILDDDPETYSRISRSDLTIDLFTENPSSARRDFVGQLLQRLLRKEGIEVPNYQTLYEKIRTTRATF
ncbi:MAG: hypothetical protein ABSF52_01320 [Syntrophobacteraceae bacterium]|jgi:hypothetical protein